MPTKKSKTTKNPAGRRSGSGQMFFRLRAGKISAKMLRKHIGVTRVVMARLVHVSERSLASYENDEATPSPSVKRRLQEVNRLRVALERIMSRADVADWLQKPNKAFDNKSPLAIIEKGETDRIWRMLYLIESGAAF